MKRREFVRSAIAATFAPAILSAQTGSPVSPNSKVVAPGPLPWMLGLNHVDDHPVPYSDVEQIGINETHLFTSTQMQTLTHLCQVLFPPMKGMPGAVDALTPDFLDFFISQSSTEVKDLYQTGLDMVDARAHKMFSKPFAALDAAQFDAVIRPFLVSWAKDHFPKDPDKHFVNRVHYDIRMATQNSGAWALARTRLGHPEPDGHLYWFPVEPDLGFRDSLPPGAPGSSLWPATSKAKV